MWLLQPAKSLHSHMQCLPNPSPSPLAKVRLLQAHNTQETCCRKLQLMINRPPHASVNNIFFFLNHQTAIYKQINLNNKVENPVKKELQSSVVNIPRSRLTPKTTLSFFKNYTYTTVQETDHISTCHTQFLCYLNVKQVTLNHIHIKWSGTNNQPL